MIVVTGGSGAMGRAIVRDLLDHGETVRSVDRLALPGLDCPQMQAEMTDLGQVFGALRGADAVIHLAAIPDPGGQPDEVVFANNVLGTFNVVQAAEMLGISRVVWASSVCAVGVPYAPPRTAPCYLPLDEDHPLLPPDCYGLSKLTGEEICRAASRRSPLTTVSLRFSWVVYPETYDALVARPDDAPGPDADNLWSYTDIHDAGTACRLALSAPLQGHQAYFIVAPDTMAAAPTPELLARYYPTVPWHGPAPRADQALISTARAAQELGWRAGYRGNTPLSESDDR